MLNVKCACQNFLLGFPRWLDGKEKQQTIWWDSMQKCKGDLIRSEFRTKIHCAALHICAISYQVIIRSVGPVSLNGSAGSQRVSFTSVDAN